MSGHGGAGAEGLKDLKWLLVILAVLWFIWLFTGGPGRADKNNPYINPGDSPNVGQTYGGHFVNPTQ